MNFKKIAIRTISEFADESPEMSLGDILYSIIRTPNSGIKDLKDLRDMSDEKIYSIVEKAKKFEKEG